MFVEPTCINRMIHTYKSHVDRRVQWPGLNNQSACTTIHTEVLLCLCDLQHQSNLQHINWVLSAKYLVVIMWMDHYKCKFRAIFLCAKKNSDRLHTQTIKSSLTITSLLSVIIKCILLTCEQHLHQRIISYGGGFNPATLYWSEQLCICVYDFFYWISKQHRQCNILHFFKYFTVTNVAINTNHQNYFNKPSPFVIAPISNHIISILQMWTILFNTCIFISLVLQYVYSLSYQCVYSLSYQFHQSIGYYTLKR